VGPEVVQEAEEAGAVDAEGYEVEAGRGAGPAGLAGEEGELGAAVIAGDHERTVGVLGPVFVLREDGEAQRPLVPAGGFVAVGNEELDVIDLVHLEHGPPQGSFLGDPGGDHKAFTWYSSRRVDRSGFLEVDRIQGRGVSLR
jgi:hypothetical protein